MYDFSGVTSYEARRSSFGSSWDVLLRWGAGTHLDASLPWGPFGSQKLAVAWAKENAPQAVPASVFFRKERRADAVRAKALAASWPRWSAAVEAEKREKEEVEKARTNGRRRKNSGAADRAGTIYALATSDGREVARMGAYQSLRAALVDAKIVAIRKRDDLRQSGDEVAKVKPIQGRAGHEIGYSVDGETGTVLTVKATMGRQPAVRLNGIKRRRNIAPAMAMAAAYEAAQSALPYAKQAAPYAAAGAKKAGKAALAVARTSGNAFDTLLDAGINVFSRRKHNPGGDRIAVPAVGVTLRLDGIDYVVERVLPFVHRSNTRFAVRLRRPGGKKKHEMVIYETGARSSIV